MEYSLIIYQRAFYDFLPFIFPNSYTLSIRELIHLEVFLRKYNLSQLPFQIKKSFFSHIIFISNHLQVRKTNLCLNKNRDLRKTTKRTSHNHLIMNAKYQRAKAQ